MVWFWRALLHSYENEVSYAITYKALVNICISQVSYLCNTIPDIYDWKEEFNLAQFHMIQSIVSSSKAETSWLKLVTEQRFLVHGEKKVEQDNRAREQGVSNHT